MNIGVIGTGDIGAVIVKKLRDAGYPVTMANSKGPDSLRELAAKTGAITVDAGTIAESWRQQPGSSPVYCTNPTKEELRLWFNKSRPNRSPG